MKYLDIIKYLARQETTNYTVYTSLCHLILKVLDTATLANDNLYFFSNISF